MRVTLSFLSLALLLLTSTSLAHPHPGAGAFRPAAGKHHGRNATIANLIAKRQTSRQQINMRKHVKDTVKRVHKAMAFEREEVMLSRMAEGDAESAVLSERAPEVDLDKMVQLAQHDLEARNPQPQPQPQPQAVVGAALAAVGDQRDISEQGRDAFEQPTPSRTRHIAARQEVTGGAGGENRRRSLPAPVHADDEPSRSRHIAARQDQATGGAEVRRSLPAPVRAEAPTRARHAARQEFTGGVDETRRRSLPARARQQREKPRHIEYEERSYPKCPHAGPRTGYAHYPGWKLAGDELSGALPIKTAETCVQTCNKYGGACSGVFFDSTKSRCYLKGTRTSAWKFDEAAEDDAVDLIGGCALWANIVPDDMNEACCRD